MDQEKRTTLHNDDYVIEDDPDLSTVFLYILGSILLLLILIPSCFCCCESNKRKQD
jgi:hypothetical protein